MYINFICAWSYTYTATTQCACSDTTCHGDKAYSASYAIRLYIDLLHRFPAQSKRYVAIKAYLIQGCAKLCHGQTKSLAAPVWITCVLGSCCNWLYMPANGILWYLVTQKPRLLQHYDHGVQLMPWAKARPAWWYHSPSIVYYHIQDILGGGGDLGVGRYMYIVYPRLPCRFHIGVYASMMIFVTNVLRHHFLRGESQDTPL
jgi:hypothetical protein